METLHGSRTDELAVDDGHLLERFVQQQDEPAFGELVRRHGPMVLGVCRRVLDNPHDAEDCFQAVFMVLVRKADSVQPRSMVGNWLYGVAYRTALEARKLAARRRVIEKKKIAAPQPEPASAWQEMRPVLDRELSKLPDNFRLVIVACDLEGKTRREVAQQLNVAEGTVASRLARARRMLAKRMSRYALSMSAGALATMLTAEAAEAVPPALASATTKAALQLASGKPGGGTISPYVAALCDAVVKSMLWTKIQVGAAGFAVLAAIAFALVALIPAVQPDRNAAAQALARPDKVKPPQYLRDCIVEKIDAGKQRVRVRHAGPAAGDGPPAVYDLVIEGSTHIFIDGKKAVLSELREGCAVQLEIDANTAGSCRARRIDAIGEELRGVVLDVDDDKITLGPAKAGVVNRTCKLDPDAWFVVNGKKTKVAGLKPRMKVTVQMSVTKPVAVGVTAAGPKVAGIVREVGKDSVKLFIDDTHGLIAEAIVPPEAEVVIDGGERKLTDVQAGMHVQLQMCAEADRSYVVAITGKANK
ncbi:MAG TPA: sigma-70 family RNA polymerase sigma factor [Gemmataceae bacterium]|nr:sigma-70 family RNA polymerase sigma factor [Gemmataceae bacterium]